MKKELNVNMALPELLENLTEENIMLGIKILHVRFGVSYTLIAKIIGVQKTKLKPCLERDCFYHKVDLNEPFTVDVINKLRRFFLGE